MTDRPIPDSIMREARGVVSEIAIQKPIAYEARARIIARALLARDERAAGIARAAGDTWSGSRDHMQAVQEAAVDAKCEEIAAAILSEDKE